MVFEDRVQALFKDPNVFGPFLVPVALVVLEEMLTPRLLRVPPPVEGPLCFFCVVMLGLIFSVLPRGMGCI